MATSYANSPFQKSTSPGAGFVAVTASDTALANGPCRGIYIGASGNVTIVDMLGNTVQFVALAVGVIHPIQATTIKAATTATSIVAVY
jgi:hypothetical protein